jgi:superfamily II DNA/RNA helicase
LILAPTRELAVQIEDQVQGLTYHTTVSSVAVFGGVPMTQQEQALKAHVDIVVATPGRLMDHMRHNAVSFGPLEVLVLDEADRMLDMGSGPTCSASSPRFPRSVKRCFSQQPCRPKC